MVRGVVDLGSTRQQAGIIARVIHVGFWVCILCSITLKLSETLRGTD